jgi:hypothetical protein
MHRNHVTEHKVDCLRCHIEIQHRLTPPKNRGMADCQSCHPNHHAQTVDLYRGQGGHGAKETPSPMLAARVPCEGCHLTHEKVGGKGVNLRAGAAGCMNCHGESYGRTLAEWETKAAAWMSWMEAGLLKARQELEEAARRGQDVASARTLYRQADENVQLVKYGRAVHNVDYAESLLRSAAAQLNRAMVQVGSSYRLTTAPPAGPKTSKQSACVRCHNQMEAVRRAVFSTVFDHGPHLLRGQLDCTRCHAAGREPQAAGHGRMFLRQEDCRRCHRQMRTASPHPAGWLRTHGPAVRSQAPVGRLPLAATAECRTCHAPTECSSCHGLAMPHPADWPVTHTRAAQRNRSLCNRCHTASYCRDCHGIDLPHPQNWVPRRHQAVARQNRALCNNCHTAWFCRACHKVDMPHPAGWRQQHGPEVEAQPTVCVRCHQQSECLVCHEKKPPSSHTADWNKRHGRVVQEGSPLCQACHGACQSCHGITMPHPAGWLPSGHGAEASFQEASRCFRCHERKYCQQCHEEEVPKVN